MGTTQPQRAISPALATVHRHLWALTAHGMSHRAVNAAAAAIGLSVNTLSEVRGGRIRTITPRTAAAVLAIVPTSDHVSALAATRRARAMATLGITAADGVPTDTMAALVDDTLTLTTHAVDQAVTAAHDRAVAAALAAFSPLAPGGDPAVRAAALAAGCVGPLAWDDDTIADACAGPEVAPPRRLLSGPRLLSVILDALSGRATYDQLTAPERVEVVRILAARGWSQVRIGNWLHWPAAGTRGHAAIQKLCQRHGIRVDPDCGGLTLADRRANLTAAA